MIDQFIDEQCKQAIQMSLIQPEEKMQFGAFISAAIAEGRRQALEEAHKSICNLTEHRDIDWIDEPIIVRINKEDALTAIANLKNK